MVFVYIVVGLIFAVMLSILLGSHKPPEPPKNITEEDIQQLLQEGQKIQAIKLYRSLHNVGLKDAKNAVERMELES